MGEDKEALYDVSEAVTGQLDKSVSAALEERVSSINRVFVVQGIELT